MAELLSPDLKKTAAPFFHPWRELSILATLAMEHCWVALWYTTFSLIGGTQVTLLKAYLVLGIQTAIAHYLARTMNAFGVGKHARRIIFAGCILAGAWASLQLLLYAPDFQPFPAILKRIGQGFADFERIPPEFWVILVILLVWARGLSLARRLAGVDRAQTSFQVGVLMVFGFAVLRDFRAFVPDRQALGLIFWFFLLGLIAMSSGRIYEAGRARGGRLTRADRSWLLGIGIAGLAVVSLGIVPALLLPAEVSLYIVRYIFVALAFLVGLAIVILSPVILAIFLALPLLQRLWRAISITFNLEDISRGLSGLNFPQSVDNLAAQITAAKPAVLWGILIVVLAAVLAGLSFRMWLERNLDPEERQMLISAADLWGLLKASFQRRLREAANDLRGRMRGGGARRLMAAARARWIYARLMGLCSRMGRPRPPAITPLEFIPDLRELFPGLDAEVGLVTETYIRVRYGDIPETGEEVARLIKAWERIQRAGRKAVKNPPSMD